MIKLERGERPAELTKEVCKELDHFLPKSINPDKVAEWDNLVPSCLRCNREKNDYEGKIVNPCVDNPQEYFAL